MEPDATDAVGTKSNPWEHVHINEFVYK